MNWDIIAGKWEQLTGRIREKWGNLTEDEIVMVAGRRDQLLGKLREKYGYTRDRAEKEVDEFFSKHTW